MLRTIAAALLFAAMAVIAAPAASAAPVFPTGLRIGLEPPAGLTVSKHFPGFEDDKSHVLVAVFEMPAIAYDQIMGGGFTKQTQDMTDVSKADFTVAGGSGYLVSGKAAVNGHGEQRWYLLAKPTAAAKGKAFTSLVRVDVPDTARTVYSDAVVRKMLASVDFRPRPVNELLGMLPFKLSDLAGFRVSQVLPAGVILTDGPGDDIGNNTQPYLVIAVGRGGPRDSNLRTTYAQDLLRSGPLNEVRFTSADNIRIDRSPALELRATAKDLSGHAVTVVQWLRFGTSGGYLRIVGVAPKDDWDKVFNRFRSVRDGIASR